MLLSKLRVVFENASGEIELWNKAASAQVDAQLRERRAGFKRRRETLERIQIAGGELERASPSSRRRTQRLQHVPDARRTSSREALREHACAAPLRDRRRARSRPTCRSLDDAVPVDGDGAAPG